MGTITLIAQFLIVWVAAVVEFFKKIPEARPIRKYLIGGWHTIVTSEVVGVISALVVKAVYVILGLNLMESQGLPVDLFINGWLVWVFAGLYAGFMASGIYPIVKGNGASAKPANFPETGKAPVTPALAPVTKTAIGKPAPVAPVVATAKSPKPSRAPKIPKGEITM